MGFYVKVALLGAAVSDLAGELLPPLVLIACMWPRMIVWPNLYPSHG